MENETLGARIRRLRQARGWTQEQLATAAETTAKSVSNWESERNLPRGSMGALRDIFGPAIDGTDVPSGDAVEVAIAKSDLDDWRKDEVRSVYRRNVQQQRDGGRLSG